MYIIHTQNKSQDTHSLREKITITENRNHTHDKNIKYQSGVKRTKVNTLKEKERMTSI